MDKIVVNTSVKHPIAVKIMQEIDGKISPKLKKPYKVVFSG